MIVRYLIINCFPAVYERLVIGNLISISPVYKGKWFQYSCFILLTLVVLKTFFLYSLDGLRLALMSKARILQPNTPRGSRK